MVDIKGMKTQDKKLLSDIKQHSWRLKHVNEREMKLPHVEGLGRVVENKGRSDMKKK